MFKTRIAYQLLIHLLLPWTLLRLLWRARRQPEYLQRVSERFGFYSQVVNGPIIWIHAVSVGETRAAQPLIKELAAHYPEYQILITHMTPTGRETGSQLFGNRVLQAYLAYDLPFAVKRFLNHFRPTAGVLMETEIWPNLIQYSHKKKIPLLLLNARLSEKSYQRYKRFPRLSEISLQQLTQIAAQTNEDAQRLLSLGANSVGVIGNIKFDIDPPAVALQLGKAWRENNYGAERPVLIFASTREGEEALIIEKLDRFNVSNLLVLIVPRHPQRFDEVASLLKTRGIKYQRRSENYAVSHDTKVVLGDSMGEMFAYYAAADIAFVGGSLLDYGGQNLIEACALGKPTIVGPYTYNFAQATDSAIMNGAAMRVRDVDQLIEVVEDLFRNRPRYQSMTRAAFEFSQTHKGATQKALAILRPYLGPNH